MILASDNEPKYADILHSTRATVSNITESIVVVDLSVKIIIDIFRLSS